ncbi:Pre-mRNA-splicing factor CEF1 [Babesia sp. Xinjiang]|uniref:Pre-mRNA-splicing factor CEF1 n=1 Tax=Babesia sp. Xinjiang TaxID=462227 RepID=UPI000A217462|nr:Pre-mRNA-splicing factor CEF1 [Babesia sp. Xinjiang]ORM39654.1 Pre-mRNA-splicing factor CEF1 [Babesia sp. Xinjiang]
MLHHAIHRHISSHLRTLLHRDREGDRIPSCLRILCRLRQISRYHETRVRDGNLWSRLCDRLKPELRSNDINDVLRVVHALAKVPYKKVGYIRNSLITIQISFMNAVERMVLHRHGDLGPRAVTQYFIDATRLEHVEATTFQAVLRGRIVDFHNFSPFDLCFLVHVSAKLRLVDSVILDAVTAELLKTGNYDQLCKDQEYTVELKEIVGVLLDRVVTELDKLQLLNDIIRLDLEFQPSTSKMQYKIGPLLDSLKVAIEVNGYSHFYHQSRDFHAITLLKYKIVNSLGWKVLSVNYFDWKNRSRQDDELDPRRLRPGEIDPAPETKPSRADAVDMDDDEKEMLAEARARLANTRGKKAKRKAREKQIEQTRRLASLQKRHELKKAGVNVGALKLHKSIMDYVKEVPFETQPPKGFYEPETGHEIDESLRSIQQLEGKRRDEELRRMRNDDSRKLKRLQEENINEAMAVFQKYDEHTATRNKLVMPAPTMTDDEIVQIVKMGADVQMFDDNVATSSFARTPMTSIMEEARMAAASSRLQTPLLGETNIAAGMRKEGNDQFPVPATPNPLKRLIFGSTANSKYSETPLSIYHDQDDDDEDPIGARLHVKASISNLPAPESDVEITLSVPEGPSDVYNEDVDMDEGELERHRAMRIQKCWLTTPIAMPKTQSQKKLKNFYNRNILTCCNGIASIIHNLEVGRAYLLLEKKSSLNLSTSSEVIGSFAYSTDSKRYVRECDLDVEQRLESLRVECREMERHLDTLAKRNKSLESKCTIATGGYLHRQGVLLRSIGMCKLCGMTVYTGDLYDRIIDLENDLVSYKSMKVTMENNVPDDPKANDTLPVNAPLSLGERLLAKNTKKSGASDPKVRKNAAKNITNETNKQTNDNKKTSQSILDGDTGEKFLIPGMKGTYPLGYKNFIGKGTSKNPPPPPDTPPTSSKNSNSKGLAGTRWRKEGRKQHYNSAPPTQKSSRDNLGKKDEQMDIGNKTDEGKGWKSRSFEKGNNKGFTPRGTTDGQGHGKKNNERSNKNDKDMQQQRRQYKEREYADSSATAEDTEHLVIGDDKLTQDERKPKGSNSGSSQDERKPKGSNSGSSQDERKPKGSNSGSSQDERKPKGSNSGSSQDERKPKGPSPGSSQEDVNPTSKSTARNRQRGKRWQQRTSTGNTTVDNPAGQTKNRNKDPSTNLSASESTNVDESISQLTEQINTLNTNGGRNTTEEGKKHRYRKRYYNNHTKGNQNDTN